MKEEREYFEDLLKQGYEEDDALTYTRKYFPDFTTDLPEPAPPPSFRTDKEVAGLLEGLDGLRLDHVIAEGILFADSLREGIVEHRQKLWAAAGLAAILLIAVLAMRIPAQLGPLEGEWMKSDGETVTFAGQGEYLDRSGFDATWSLDGNVLEVMWSDLPNNNAGDDGTVIIQSGRVSLDDDGRYLWLRWDSLTVNGEDATPSDTCILLINAREVNSIPTYVEYSESTVGAGPSWCTG